MAKINTNPEVRFAGFSENWEERELSKILTERKAMQKITEDAPILAFAAGQGVIDRSERKSNNRDHLTHDQENKIYKLTELNDIVYNPSNLKYGAIDRNKYGRGVISPIYVTFTTGEEPSFVELIVKSEKFKLRALQYEEGTVVKRQSVKPENLLSLKVNISPSKYEQKKIGELFECFEKLITLHRNRYEKLIKIKQAMLEKLFPKQNSDNPDIRVGGNKNSWVIKKISEIATINPKSELPDIFKYVDLESVVGTKMMNFREVYKSKAPSRAQRLARQGDLFYQMVRPYQRNNYLFEAPDTDYVFSTGYSQLRPVIDGNFLLSLVQSNCFLHEVMIRCTGSSYPAINSSDLAEIDILNPENPNEQIKIGTFFKSLDSLINLNQTELIKMKELRKAFSDKMFV